jgi:hypothetical protein
MSNRKFTKRKKVAITDPEQKKLERLRRQATARLLKRRRRKSHQ